MPIYSKMRFELYLFWFYCKLTKRNQSIRLEPDHPSKPSSDHQTEPSSCPPSQRTSRAGSGPGQVQLASYFFFFLQLANQPSSSSGTIHPCLLSIRPSSWIWYYYLFAVFAGLAVLADCRRILLSKFDCADLIYLDLLDLYCRTSCPPSTGRRQSVIVVLNSFSSIHVRRTVVYHPSVELIWLNFGFDWLNWLIYYWIDSNYSIHYSKFIEIGINYCICIGLGRQVRSPGPSGCQVVILSSPDVVLVVPSILPVPGRRHRSYCTCSGDWRTVIQPSSYHRRRLSRSN